MKISLTLSTRKTLPMAKYSYLQLPHLSADQDSKNHYLALYQSGDLYEVEVIFAIDKSNPFRAHMFNGFLLPDSKHKTTDRFYSFFSINTMALISDIHARINHCNFKEDLIENHTHMTIPSLSTNVDESLILDLRGVPNQIYDLNRVLYSLFDTNAIYPEVEKSHGIDSRFRVFNFDDYYFISLPIYMDYAYIPDDLMTINSEKINIGDYDTLYTSLYNSHLYLLVDAKTKLVEREKLNYILALIETKQVNSLTEDDLFRLRRLKDVIKILKTWHIPYDSRSDNFKAALPIIEQTVIAPLNHTAPSQVNQASLIETVKNDIKLYLSYYPSTYGRLWDYTGD